MWQSLGLHYACLPTPCFGTHICFLLAPFVFVVSLGRAENPQCTQLWTVVIWMTHNDPPNCTQRFMQCDHLDGNDERKRNTQDV